MKQSHKAFIFISGALETKSWKKSKKLIANGAEAGLYFGGSGSILLRMPTVSSMVAPTISRLLGLRLLSSVILGRVPEDVVVAVIEVDKVGGGHASLHERNVIVLHARNSPSKKVRLIAKPGRRLIDDASFEGHGVEFSIIDRC